MHIIIEDNHCGNNVNILIQINTNKLFQWVFKIS
jgi:hypothetical protein